MKKTEKIMGFTIPVFVGIVILSGLGIFGIYTVFNSTDSFMAFGDSITIYNDGTGSLTCYVNTHNDGKTFTIPEGDSKKIYISQRATGRCYCPETYQDYEVIDSYSTYSFHISRFNCAGGATTTIPSGDTCVETDSGADYTQKGTCKKYMDGQLVETKTDYCDDSQHVYEYYCDYKDDIIWVWRLCDYGSCENGECQGRCTSNDEHCVSKPGKPYGIYVYCASDGELKEKDCTLQGEKCGYEDGSYGCVAITTTTTAPTRFCWDFGYYSVNVGGQCSPIYVPEISKTCYYCPAYTTTTLPPTTCEDLGYFTSAKPGYVCSTVWIPSISRTCYDCQGTTPPPENFCTDTDGGQDYDVAGEIHYRWNNEEGYTSDYCEGDGFTLHEYYCNSDGSWGEVQNWRCDGGCLSGVCISGNEEKDPCTSLCGGFDGDICCWGETLYTCDDGEWITTGTCGGDDDWDNLGMYLIVAGILLGMVVGTVVVFGGLAYLLTKKKGKK